MALAGLKQVRDPMFYNEIYSTCLILLVCITVCSDWLLVCVYNDLIGYWFVYRMV